MMTPEEAIRIANEKFPDLVREQYITSDASFDEMQKFRAGERRGFALGLTYAGAEDETKRAATPAGATVG